MPVTQVSLGRLLTYPLGSQIRSVQRTRAEQPERLVAWFRHLEVGLPAFQQAFAQLETPAKDAFMALQMVFEAIMERPFLGAQQGNITRLGLTNAFQVMPDFVKVVARGNATGLLIVGPGGTGKTWTVLETLEAEGKKEGRDFFRVPGYTSPLGLYNFLYEKIDKLIVFDDCDIIFKDEHGINTLKSVLDTLPHRIVSWRSSSSLVSVPQFEFKGRIIFISNMEPAKSTNVHFQALLTRVMTLMVGSSKEELLLHMVSKMPEIGKELTFAQRDEILTFLKDNYRQYNTLSLRLLVNLVGLRRYSATNWKALAKALS